MTRSILSLVLIAILAASSAWAKDPLKEATFTQVVNQVNIVKRGDQTVAAKPGAVFRAPETVLTGPSARAELKARDGTLTRLGANTNFRFGQEPRTIFLEQGNVLFYSPTGKGGGTIKTAGATAGVMGSTNMVSATSNGGFKVLSLEHRTKVFFKKMGLFGKTRVLKPGQLTFVLPGAKRLPPVFEFRMDLLVNNSELIKGFGVNLPSLGAIKHNAQEQARQIASGKKEDTGALIGGVDENGQVELIDGGTRQAFFTSQIEQQFEEIVEEIDPTNLDLIIDTTEISEEFVIVDTEALLSFLNFFDIPEDVILETDDSDNPFDVEVSLSSLAVVAARNIFVRTTEIDLSPYADRSAFAFFAGELIVIEQSVNISGYHGPLGFFGAQGVEIEPGSRIGFDGASLSIQTGGSIDFRRVTLLNMGGDLTIQASGSVNLANVNIGANGPISIFSNSSSTLTASNTDIIGRGAVDLFAEGNINISGSRIRVNDFGNNSLNYGFIAHSFNGNLNIANTVFDAPAIFLDALNGNINIGGSVSNPISFPVAEIAMAARTINLVNVDFANGSIVNLFVQTGMLAPDPNTGKSSQAGYVNFINNVTYGGNPAQNYVPYSAGGSAVYPSDEKILIHSTNGPVPPPAID